MSRNRAGGAHRHALVNAANFRTLGQVPLRRRRVDGPVVDEPITARPAGPDRRGGTPPVDPVPTREWSRTIARLLAATGRKIVPRAELRAAMPNLGQIPATGNKRGRSSSGGTRSSAQLADILVDWEREGWIRRNGDDTVSVLDRHALLEWAASEGGGS